MRCVWNAKAFYLEFFKLGDRTPKLVLNYAILHPKQDICQAFDLNACVKFILSHDVMSESIIKSCIKKDNPLVD